MAYCLDQHTSTIANKILASKTISLEHGNHGGRGIFDPEWNLFPPFSVLVTPSPAVDAIVPHPMQAHRTFREADAPIAAAFFLKKLMRSGSVLKVRLAMMKPSGLISTTTFLTLAKIDIRSKRSGQKHESVARIPISKTSIVFLTPMSEGKVRTTGAACSDSAS